MLDGFEALGIRSIFNAFLGMGKCNWFLGAFFFLKGRIIRAGCLFCVRMEKEVYFVSHFLCLSLYVYVYFLPGIDYLDLCISDI